MRHALTGAALALLLVACGAKDAPIQVSEVRVLQSPAVVASSDMTTAERFGYGAAAATHTSASVSHDNCPHTDQGVKGECCPDESLNTAVRAQAVSLTWDSPPSWTEGEEKPLRLGTYKMGESARAECYVTVLPGAAGGLAANIDRWRGQMGQTPLGAETIDSLPTVIVLGGPARYVEIKGDFTNMAGEMHPGFMMLGLVSQLPGQAVFVKMVGPEEDVLSEKDNFIAFCESLKAKTASG